MQAAPVAQVRGTPRALDGRSSLRTSQAVCLRPSRTSTQRCRREALIVRAERSSGSGFATGFLLGGAIFGALGFVFAPQISSALLGDDQKLRLPRFLEEDADPEATKDNLRDKIAQLNAAIDEISGQLASDQPQAEVVPAAGGGANGSNSAAAKEPSRA